MNVRERSLVLSSRLLCYRVGSDLCSDIIFQRNIRHRSQLSKADSASPIRLISAWNFELEDCMYSICRDDGILLLHLRRVEILIEAAFCSYNKLCL